MKVLVGSLLWTPAWLGGLAHLSVTCKMLQHSVLGTGFCIFVTSPDLCWPGCPAGGREVSLSGIWSMMLLCSPHMSYSLCPCSLMTPDRLACAPAY